MNVHFIQHLESLFNCVRELLIQSHIQRVVYGASDTRWMSLDKLIHLPDPKLNYIPMIQSDILKR